MSEHSKSKADSLHSKEDSERSKRNSERSKRNSERSEECVRDSRESNLRAIERESCWDACANILVLQSELSTSGHGIVECFNVCTNKWASECDFLVNNSLH